MPDGVIGNTSDFGSEEYRFETCSGINGEWTDKASGFPAKECVPVRVLVSSTTLSASYQFNGDN